MRCKYALCAVLIAMFALGSAATADFGVQLYNSTGIAYEIDADAPAFFQYDRASLWLSALLGPNFDFQLAAFYEFNFSANPDGTTVLKPYRFDVGRSVLNGVIPGIGGPSSILGFSVGRFPLQDFSGRIVSGLNDGFLVNLALGNNQIKLAGAYLGLQEKQTALVMIDDDDLRRLAGLDKPDSATADFPAYYFSLPRMFFSTGYRVNELLTGHDFGFDLFAQFDLLPGEQRTHTYYFEPYVAGRLGRLFRWNAWYVLELIQKAEISTAMAAGGRLRFAAPELRGLNSTLAVSWASGKTGASLADFAPIRQSLVSAYTALYFENLLHTSLSFGFTPFSGFSASVLGGLFLRGGEEAPKIDRIDPAATSVLTGFDAACNFQYSIASDVLVNIGAGGFFPNPAAFSADARTALKANFILILDL